MALTLGSRFDASRNNFDALRLGAALVVLLSHSYSLTGAPWEPISTWFGYGYGGTLAVAVFFVMSGFLVSRSLETRDLSSFVRGRLLRIMPGLAFVTVIEAFVIAPLFYEGPVGVYFSNFALPHLRNILVFGEDPAIPGVFSKLPFPYVNGSLWTLPVESFFYLLLPFLALAARGRPVIVLLAWIISLLAEPVARWQGLDDAHFGGFLVQTVRLFSIAEFSSYFLAGVAAWTYRDRIPFSAAAAILCLLLLWVAKGQLAAPMLLKICLPYLVLFAALQGGAGSRLKRRIGDLSYGLYLFSYPLTNVVIALNPQFSSEVVAGMAATASLAAAWVSWRLVEAPALRAKRRATPDQPRPSRWTRLAPLLRPAPPGGNFTALRLFAVGLVVYGNGLLLTGGAPTAYWGAPLSRIGLDLLFAISGYLALESWERRPGMAGFALRRVVRLLPGLVACVLLTVALLGPIATTLPLRAYPLNKMTLQYLSNIMLVPSLWLPGVFQGQQWSGAVNPMLWTLGGGMMLWTGIAVIGCLPARFRVAALGSAAALCMVAPVLLGPKAAEHPRLLEIATEAPFFLVAALYRQWQDRWPGLWRADVAILLFAANWVSATWLGADNFMLECLSLPYMAIAFGRMSAPVLGQAGRLGNPSYGFYLYAFPLQQLIVARWPGLTDPVLASGALALLAGFLSWHLVERPALAWLERRHDWSWPTRLRHGAASSPR